MAKRKSDANKKDVPEQEQEEQDGSSTSNNDNNTQPRKKQAKKEPVTPLDPSVPTNKVFPTDLAPFPRPVNGSIRLSSFNLAGLKAANKKGLKYYVEAEDADILSFTETKLQAEPNTDDTKYLKDKYKFRYWGADTKAGYAGVAILSKIEPLTVTEGLPTIDTPDATKGRIITLEFQNFYYTATYVPNAGDGLKNMDFKKKWNEAFEAYIRKLDKTKPVIWMGDFNVAPTEMDIRNPTTNWNKSPGYTEIECNAFKRLLENSEPDPGPGPFVDVWRNKHPDLRGHYSYYSYRFNCREKGIGWRLDGAVLSERWLDRVEQCEMRQECYGLSDHIPVILDINVA